jgi:hypothetical protein
VLLKLVVRTVIYVIVLIEMIRRGKIFFALAMMGVCNNGRMQYAPTHHPVNPIILQILTMH